MRLRKLIKAIEEITPIEVEVIDRKTAKVSLKEYDLKYDLHSYDWYFIEALQIVHFTQLKTGEKIKKDLLIDLRFAIREDANHHGSLDANHHGSLFEDYFYLPPDFDTLKDEVNKRYIRDYIKFINRLEAELIPF